MVPTRENVSLLADEANWWADLEPLGLIPLNFGQNGMGSASFDRIRWFPRENVQISVQKPFGRVYSLLLGSAHFSLVYDV